MSAMQLLLLGRERPALPASFERARRVELDAASFLEYVPGFVCGHATLFEELERAMSWRSERRVMYDREVDVPRLLASVPEDGPAHPVLAEAAARLSARYAVELDAITLALYRDGNDSVAWHADHVRDPRQSLVAIISLGTPRKFMLRPNGGATAIVQGFGHGDLLVMGGACQAGFQHCIPKTKRADPRMAVMFRNRASYRD
jgi:alkylated DNA repair dioxygenase AlkB